MDIQKLNYEYPEFSMNFGYPILGYSKMHWFLDIQKWIMDIQKLNYGYPKFSMIFGYPKMH